MSIMGSVLKKVQLHYNIDELREIDDDAIDDDVRMMSSQNTFNVHYAGFWVPKATHCRCSKTAIL